MLSNFKVEKILVEIIEDDEGKVHQALRHNNTCYSLNQYRELEGICDSCNEVTRATIGHIEKWINISNEEDVQYELVYRCKECNKIHGRIQIFSTK